MLEAMRAVDEGLTPATVDEAMLAFGMPMGPIELIDMVGLDVAMAAGKSLAGAGASRRAACLSTSTPATLARSRAGVSTSIVPAGRSKARPGRSRPVSPSASSGRCSSVAGNW
jgi:3-hydroxyacyl-CoA dehydrogenase/enoyl-CoA hydratase/3-hydroxybutyryl-CoA epimerase